LQATYPRSHSLIAWVNSYSRSASINGLSLWTQIISKKISNQARTLSIIGRDKAEQVAEYVNKINRKNVDIIESTAAKEYFSYYHEGLNRRVEDPINSRFLY